MDIESPNTSPDSEQESNFQREKLEDVDIGSEVSHLQIKAKELVQKIPDDMFEDAVEGFEDKKDSIFYAVREIVSKGPDAGSDANLPESPMNNSGNFDDLQFDIAGLITYVRQQVNNSYFTEEVRNDLKDIANAVEETALDIFEKVDFADPDALVFSMKSASDSMQKELWGQVSEKYRGTITNDSLEYIIEKAGPEEVRKEAWEILREREDVEPIVLKRIRDYVSIEEIKSQASQKLLDKLNDLESAAESGDDDAQQTLDEMGQANGTY